ncbi:MAG: NADH:flavin oxidoreductase [Pirellulales bacterium]|nr:NADH:flavin oxidoreductase [Pirellulales bacterium]
MAETANHPKVAQLKDVAAFRARLAELQLDLPVDEAILSAEEGSPLAEPISVAGHTVGNRWCIHPMEGWDANRDGSPSPHTLRRWRNFGLSGAKLIWGGEAAAVRPDGRANPNQTMAIASNRRGLAALLNELTDAHRESFGTLDGLLVGLQLTHSGRFCKPEDHHKMAPRIAYHHPLLDAKFKIDPRDDSLVWTDSELEQLIDDYVIAARLAHEVGFQFVDVKACHGYLLHEFLSARSRPGRFGGDLAGRSRVLTTVIDRIHNEVRGLAVGVRLSLFDSVPYQTSREIGRPMEYSSFLPYEYGFGLCPNDPLSIDLGEPLELIESLIAHGVATINLSCGSPYYNPHIQRPAIFPPIDGYQPPEDPLVGVWRQIDAVRQCKAALETRMQDAGGRGQEMKQAGSVPIVGTGYTYLQDYLPHVAQAVVREGWTDFVGVGRLVLSYPELPADTLAGRPLARKRICRTFSDCTTAPRNGLISGCYPLDHYYKELPEREGLLDIKRKWQS